jgi:hypothetical protein
MRALAPRSVSSGLCCTSSLRGPAADIVTRIYVDPSEFGPKRKKEGMYERKKEKSIEKIHEGEK